MDEKQLEDMTNHIIKEFEKAKDVVEPVSVSLATTPMNEIGLYCVAELLQHMVDKIKENTELPSGLQSTIELIAKECVSSETFKTESEE